MSPKTDHSMFPASFRNALLIMLVLALGSGIVTAYRDWLNESNIFDVSSVDVRGNDLLSEEEILELGELRSGLPIWKVNLEKSTQSLRTNFLIENATVRRKLPNKIFVEIQEKQPVVLLNFQGRLYCLDPSGMVLPSKPGKVYNLPMISGDFKGGVAVGNRVQGEWISEGLKFVLSVRRDRPRLYGAISEVIVGEESGLMLHVNQSNFLIYIGDSGYYWKIRSMEAILERLKRENKLAHTRYIDLRYKDQVIVGRRT